MKKLIIILSLALGFNLYFFSTVLAGACFCANYTVSAGTYVSNLTNRCYDGTTYDGSYPPNPNGKKPITSQADCNGTINLGMAGVYSNCTYTPSDNCTNKCVADGMFKSDKTCQSAADCTSVSGSDCCENICFYNSPEEAGGGYYRDTPKVKITAPVLSIAIPFVSFSKPDETLDANGNVRIPFLAEYLTGVYKFAIIAGSLVAVIVIIMNGFRVTISGGGQEKNKAVQGIIKAITGLFILWSSYALFYIINPALTQFSDLKVAYVQPVQLEHEAEVTNAAPVVTSTMVKASGTNISKGSNVTLDPQVLEKVQRAALELKSKDIVLYISSGYRDIEKQIELIKENCNNEPGKTTCDPKPGKPITCMLVGMDPKNCPHTTGRAVDVWGMQDGAQCVKQDACSRDKNTDACRKNACQAAVIAAMKAAGFCNLDSEAWHFEYPQMSPSCSN